MNIYGRSNSKSFLLTCWLSSTHRDIAALCPLLSTFVDISAERVNVRCIHPTGCKDICYECIHIVGTGATATEIIIKPVAARGAAGSGGSWSPVLEVGFNTQ